MDISRKYLPAGVIVLAVILIVIFYPNSYGNRKSPTPAAAPVSYLVIYSDHGFNSSSISIGVPTPVTFKNESSRSFWLTPKNQSSTYPCVDYTQLGMCEAILPGASWTGEFRVPGVWDYYDKLDPVNSVRINAIALPS
jgi:hypothetical protein